MSELHRPRAPVQIPSEQASGGPELREASRLIRVFEARSRFDVRGDGHTVAVLDTGINTKHADFDGRIVAQLNLTSDNGGASGDATDGDGHGTNVAGIIAANADHIGIAPGASLVPIKVLANNGSGSFADIARGLEWVLEHQSAYNITVVSMSLGDSSNTVSDANLFQDPIRQLIKELTHRRVAVVVAAGNDYFAHDSRQGMGYPAIIRECVSVGAVYDSDVGAMAYVDGATAYETGEDRITPFSQRLHPSVSPDCYTRIFAPGAPIRSSGLPTGTTNNGESVQDGTSQAAPVIAGVLVLMQQLYRRKTGRLPEVADLVDWLRRSGATILDGDDENDNVKNSNLTYRRVDALAALDLMSRQLETHQLKTALGMATSTTRPAGVR